ncbi:uncharacterized protein LOC141590577 [Silene latifolia]|uniref:uncharacterized protein LOC141590577 n=1 Tax=Silene latifolia TaxID=37657 RepID=UPI003D76CDA2
MEPPNVNIDDFIYWKYTSDGLYSVSSAYKILIAEKAKTDANVPELLLQKGLQISPHCVLCKRHPETVDHLFRHCEVAQVIWKSGDLGLRASMNPHIPLRQWISELLFYIMKNERHHSRYSITIFFSTLWAIWLARNEIEFQKRNVTPHQILNRSKELTHRQLLLFSIERIPQPPSNWRSTYDEDHYIQVAAIRGKQYGISGIALFSEDTRELHGTTIRSSSLVHAQSTTLLLALQWALTHNFAEAIFLTPSQQLVRALSVNAKISVHICNTIVKIKEYSYRFTKCRFQFCNSSEVRIALDVSTTYAMCSSHNMILL